MKTLITGITGFVGSHLAELLLAKKNVEVFGIERWRSDRSNISHIKDKLEFIECDIRDFSSVKKVIEKIKPEKIFHLAAQSFVPTSWNAPAETLHTNIIGQLNLFEAVRETGIKPWIQIACSSEEYGQVYENEVPITEENILRPLSPYAVSKVGQDMLGYQYFKSYGLKIVRTRGFNHTGPRRGDVFVSSNFCKQVAMIEKKKQDPVIKVGNLEAIRDFTDVRDMVKAYWAATEGGCKPGEAYNICSGKGYQIQQIIDMLRDMTKVKISLEQDPKRMRPSDVPILLGSNKKFCTATGWKPEIPFEKTLEDLLNYWRTKIA
ncbi:MAG: NAD-dependent epimerase/dehydratase family protein [Elusimicrobia bacterium]|nr:NAD-dependent epimerase/dehydratase family protein [Elusimicrobiota bacterium]MBD3412259.1 NAD-dependent epimerase/dehydratase family protein [Elusimicrobiota bacterium]